jgi:hypothetical protein
MRRWVEAAKKVAKKAAKKAGATAPTLGGTTTATTAAKKGGTAVDAETAITTSQFEALTASIKDLRDTTQASIQQLQQTTGALQQSVGALQQTVGALVGCNPAAALNLCKPAVAACVDATSAVVDGATATWTFVSRNGRFYALGCAHCALYYGTRGGDLSFVSLPKSVVDCEPVQIGFLDPATFRNPLPTWQDFVAIEVKGPPDGSQPTPWGAPISAACDFYCIAGRATSGNVTGEGHLVVSKSPGPTHGVFVEMAGEPGHSGTLLFGFGGGSDPTPIGLYCGILEVKHGMRCRGRVALFPTFDAIAWTAIHNPTESTAMEVIDRQSVRTCLWDAATMELVDGDTRWPGVFVEHVFSYIGSLDMGSCRAK